MKLRKGKKKTHLTFSLLFTIHKAPSHAEHRQALNKGLLDENILYYCSKSHQKGNKVMTILQKRRLETGDGKHKASRWRDCISGII